MSVEKKDFLALFQHLKPHLPSHIHKEILTMDRLFPNTFSRLPALKITLRLCHFLSQCAHESGNFQHTEENLNYAAHDLKRLFLKYFPTHEMQHFYAHQPEKIGSRVYANRMGNGDEASTEGFMFRGRGYLQLTGKENYAAFRDFIIHDCVRYPEYVAQKYPMISASWYFNHNQLWPLCDQGPSIQVITELTQRINGGVHGLKKRIQLFDTFFSILNPSRDNL